jgi:hypothetical protein
VPDRAQTGRRQKCDERLGNISHVGDNPVPEPRQFYTGERGSVSGKRRSKGADGLNSLA